MDVVHGRASHRVQRPVRSLHSFRAETTFAQTKQIPSQERALKSLPQAKPLSKKQQQNQEPVLLMGLARLHLPFPNNTVSIQ